MSLRARLTIIILAPLIAVALAVGALAFRDAELRAEEAFDRSLLATAFAVSRDTAFSGGDALGARTRDLLRDTSGGRVFYHVYGPDGVFVTGYATPPASSTPAASQDAPFFFSSVYFGREVRAVRLREPMRIDGLAGAFTVTVWQDMAVRDAAVAAPQIRSFFVIAALISALVLIVWFGVRRGLRPLDALENAIERRSASDLTPIRRAVPVEVRGAVGRLNRLLAGLSAELEAKDAFISNAAHQLRNPAAGVMSLAEAAAAAPTDAARRERTRDLVEAARRSVRLTEDLLALERARGRAVSAAPPAIDVAETVRALRPALTRDAALRGCVLTLDVPDAPIRARVDPVMLEQAVLNLVGNALAHGGAPLTQVALSVMDRDGSVVVRVADDGVGIAPDQFELALSRFGQVRPSEGSGLGLPIARAAAEGAGGGLRLTSAGSGLTAELRLPGAAAS